MTRMWGANRCTRPPQPSTTRCWVAAQVRRSVPSASGQRFLHCGPGYYSKPEKGRRMPDASTTLHESTDIIGNDVVERHRAIVSIGEELEAVDWYDQRAAATTDPALRAV